MTGKKEPFVPLTPGTATMYVCGVTVYDKCHIGHARALLTFDVICRYLRFLGFDTRFVRNFTDVDDKIINRAREEGVPPEELAQRYIDEFHRDAAALGLVEPTVEPRATAHVPEMIAIIAHACWNTATPMKPPATSISRWRAFGSTASCRAAASTR